MNLNNLYSYAEENNIPVISFDMPKSESMSVLYDGNWYVGIDRLTIKNETDEKEKLAHELGHCATGSFYNEYAKCDIREKHERRANIWKIKKLIPKDKLIEVINSGFGENRWELSQYFDVTEDTMQFALDYYKETA